MTSEEIANDPGRDADLPAEVRSTIQASHMPTTMPF